MPSKVSKTKLKQILNAEKKGVFKTFLKNLKTQLFGVISVVTTEDFEEVCNPCTTTTTTTSTTTTTTTIVPVSCGQVVTFGGGQSFPTIRTITLGTGTGIVTLTIDTGIIPDKFVVVFDNTVVIDTGYRGDSSYQTLLNNTLTALSLPPELIQGTGTGTFTFNKTSTITTATVYVYAPLPDTGWTFTLSCPVVPTTSTTTTTTLPPTTTTSTTSTTTTLATTSTSTTTTTSGGPTTTSTSTTTTTGGPTTSTTTTTTTAAPTTTTTTTTTTSTTTTTTTPPPGSGERHYGIINPGEGDFYFNVDNFNDFYGVAPGDIVVLMPGVYGHIDITNINGVTFVNEGGQAVIDSFNFNNGATNVRLMGNGHIGTPYGIKLNGATNFAIRWYATGDLEVAYVEVDGCLMGLQILTDPSETYPLNYQNGSIHHCFIHDVDQEGIYLGASNLGGPFMNFQVYNNLLENTGRDGIQTRNGTFLIENNSLDFIGQNNEAGHQHGILFGGNSQDCIIRYNSLSNISYGYGVFSNGYGNIQVYCNIIDSANVGIFGKNYENYEDLQGVGTQNYDIHDNTITTISSNSIEILYTPNDISVNADIYNNNIDGSVYSEAPTGTVTNNNNSVTVSCS